MKIKGYAPAVTSGEKVFTVSLKYSTRVSQLAKNGPLCFFTNKPMDSMRRIWITEKYNIPLCPDENYMIAIYVTTFSLTLDTFVPKARPSPLLQAGRSTAHVGANALAAA